MALAGGILIAWCSHQAIGWIAACALIAFACSAPRRHKMIFYLALLFGAVWLGAVLYVSSCYVSSSDVSRLPATTLTLHGTVGDEVVVEDEPHTDEPRSASFVLDVSSVHLETDEGSGSKPVTGRVAVRMALRSRVTHVALPETSLPDAGDEVELRGRLEIPDAPRNPGGFDYRAALARRGIYATLTVGRPEQAHIVRRSGWRNPFLSLAHAMRRGVLTACRSAIPSPGGGILAGILIGERHGIPLPIQEEFERTGTTHILATAGLHVGIVVCLLTFALRRSGLPRRPALIGAIGALILYAVMAGERAAVLRAVIVGILYIGGELLDREPDLPNALAVAAFILLVANPRELFDPGFQLSFATVVTIVLLMPALQRPITGLRRAVPGETEHSRRVRTALHAAASLALLAVAAQAGAGPLVAYYFNNFSLVSVAANALVVPVVFLVIANGFTMSALHSVHPALSIPFEITLRWLVAIIRWVVHIGSEAPSASINVAPPSPIWIALYYLVVWTAAWSFGAAFRTTSRAAEAQRMRAVRKIAVGAAVTLAVLVLWTGLRPKPRELRVTFLDVGQGDACVIESPSGKVLLIDTGGLLNEGEDDVGRRVVAPYLRYRGITVVNTVVLTHPHADHIGGAATLLRRFPTVELLDDGEAYGSQLIPTLYDEAARDHTRRVTALPGQRMDFGDGVTAEVLGPPDSLAGMGANNASVVLRVRYGRTAFLMTGDAEAPEEAEILAAGKDLACDVLKVGHHGSRTSSTAAFVAAAHPQFAVVSVGKRNLYGHPSPEVLGRLRASGSTVYRTDRDGAVTCHSDGVSVRCERMLR